ncbi:hypothetical protein K32_31700 [Kaistia sp. 32K]|nr:hypothetical protein K32_31700 [Kaistia sp. 32K]
MKFERKRRNRLRPDAYPASRLREVPPERFARQDQPAKRYSGAEHMRLAGAYAWINDAEGIAYDRVVTKDDRPSSQP